MDGQEVHVAMLKTVSATIVYTLGISLTFGSALIAVAAMLQ